MVMVNKESFKRYQELSAERQIYLDPAGLPATFYYIYPSVAEIVSR
jgi:hypothetical protein